MAWSLPSEMSAQEKKIAARPKRTGRFYVFLREVLPELFDASFQEELEKAFAPRGQEPLSAVLLATVTLLQAYDQASVWIGMMRRRGRPGWINCWKNPFLC